MKEFAPIIKLGPESVNVKICCLPASRTLHTFALKAEIRICTEIDGLRGDS